MYGGCLPCPLYPLLKKTIISVTYENNRISIRNSLPYIKCVLHLSCVLHGPIYGRFLGCTVLFSLSWFTQTLSELVGHASPLKRKIIGCPFLSYSSRGRYWVSVNPARENQPTEPSSGLLESEPNGRKSKASGKSTTVPFGRILAAFDYLNTRVPNCGKIWPNNISYRNSCLRVLHITLLFPH